MGFANFRQKQVDFSRFFSATCHAADPQGNRHGCTGKRYAGNNIQFGVGRQHRFVIKPLIRIAQLRFESQLNMV
jgi:hypothetical protein